MKKLMKNKYLNLCLLFILVMVTLVTCTVTFSLSEDTYASENIYNVGDLVYDGANYAMASSIKVTLTNSSKVNGQLISSGSRLKIVWSKDKNLPGHDDFVGSHNMSILSCNITIKRNGNQIKNYTNPPKYATRLGTEVIYDTSTADEGFYEISYNAHFESWGTNVKPSGTSSFYIDRSSPTANISGVSNGGITKSNVTVGWSKKSYETEISAEYSINGGSYQSYSKDTALTQNGSYNIVLKDLAGNSSSYSFRIDKTIPTITVDNGLTNGAYTNKSFTVRANDDNFAYIEYTENGLNWSKHYSTSISITSNGTWQFRAVDTANNKSEAIAINRSDRKPTGQLSGVENGGRTKSNVKFSYTTGAIISVTLNNLPYESNDTIREEGNHIIRILDKYGNSNQYTFTIDKTPPHYTLAGVLNGGRTNKDVNLSWGEGSASATLNGEPYSLGSKITFEGNYTFILTDDVGNFVTLTFTIDKTAPDYKINGVENGGKTKSNVWLSWTESGATATLNGEPYASGTFISSEGKYEFRLSDSLGNTNLVTFEIDKTAPDYNISNVENGGRTNKNVTLSWDESGATATLNGQPYSSGSVISAEGDHVIVLQDTLGNKINITFKIDKTPPHYTLAGVENGGRTKSNVSLSWTESGATATLNGEPYASGTFISSEENYELVLSDALGNSVTIYFEIDKTAPYYQLDGVDTGGRTKSNVSLSWTESGATATLNGQPYSSGSVISAEGDHVIVLQDALGNKVNITFEIDKTPPRYTLAGVENGGRTKSNVSLSWTESGATATLNGEPYASGTIISYEGSFELELQDSLGNSIIVAFEIDKTPPAFNFSLNYSAFEDGIYYFNKNVSLLFSEPGAFAEVNGKSYYSGEILSCAENSSETYILKLYDSLENYSTIEIVILKEKYLNNYNFFNEFYKASIPSWYETYAYTFINNKYVAGTYYSFTSQEDILNFAISRENKIVESHNAYKGGNSIFCDYANRYVDSFDVNNLAEMLGKPYDIYISLDNPNNLTAYFDKGKLSKAIIKYAQSSLAKKFLPSKPVQPFPGSDETAAQSIWRTEFFVNADELSFKYKPNNISLYINGIKEDYATFVFTEGPYTVQEYDFAGNCTEYTVILDPKPCIVEAYDFGDSKYTDLSEYFNNRTTINVSHQFRAKVFDNYDNAAIFSVEFNGSLSYITCGYYDFIESGTYIVKTFDIAGNKKEYTINVSLILPTITINDVIENYKIIAFTCDINLWLSINSINSIKIELYNAQEDSWAILTRDDNNLPITNKNLNYYFFTNGFYRVTIIDNYGRAIEVEYEFVKDSPKGNLFNNKNLEIKSGTSTNEKVYFNWDESECFATLNGDVYIKRTFIENEGEYTIRLEDRAGNFSIYTFTIDKTPPRGTLDGVTNGGKTNLNVTFSWDEDGATAFLKKNNEDLFYNYNNGALIVGEGSYVIKIVDIAGNERTYTFTIKKTAPTVTIYTSSGILVNDNSTIRENFYFDWSENGTTVTLNGKPYSKKSVLSKSNIYVLIIADSVGNTAYYSVTLDNLAPEFTIDGVLNNGQTNTDVAVFWDEDGATALLNGESYDSGNIISNDGTYELILSDTLGNSVVIKFTIDKTPPTYELSGTKENGITNKNVSVIWKEKNITATLNGSPYKSGNWIMTEGSHVIVLADALGNSVTINFEIDKTPPSYTVNSLDSIPSYLNYDVQFNWTEEDVTATLNGVIYNKNSIISDDNEYVFVLQDRAGNSQKIVFNIRKTIAQYNLDGVKENGFSSKSVKFSWTESGASATLNGKNYSNGLWISAEGTHKLIFTDVYGNQKEIIFTIDKNLPKLNFSDDVQNGAVVNHEVIVTWDISSYVVKVNGNIIINGSILDVAPDSSAIFNIEVMSVSGVINNYKIEIDKIKPTGNLTGVLNGGRTNTNVSLTWSERAITATLNGIDYVNGKWVTEEGIYELILCDAANNKTIYKFEIYRKSPVYVLTGVDENGITNSDVSLYWFDEFVTATLNGQPYALDEIISSSDKYVLILTDILGNTTTLQFEIDKVPPIFTLKGVIENGYTSENVIITWTEEGAAATLNGELYLSGTVITENGDYSFELIDAAGNSSFTTFYINSSEISVIVDGLNDNMRAKDLVVISWQFDNATATLNGEPYISGNAITEEGYYKFKIVNVYGKMYQFEFEIDKTPPSFVLNGVLENEFTKNNVNIHFNEIFSFAKFASGEDYISGSSIKESGFYEIIINDDLGNYYIIKFGINKELPRYELIGVLAGDKTNSDVYLLCDDPFVKGITLNGLPYTFGDIISAQGVYNFIITNNVNIEYFVEFEIDKTPPVFTINGVVNNGVTKTNVSLECTENEIKAYFVDADFDAYDTYIINSIISQEGYYRIKIQDALGNYVIVEFEIDKSAPNYQLDGVETGGRTNKDVLLSWDEEGASATINGEPYISNQIISNEGNYELVLSDALGNSVTIIFEIDKTPPVFTINGVDDSGLTNGDVQVIWEERSATALLNGTPYSSGMTVRSEGNYELVLSDALGNSVTIIFEIDKTPPDYNIAGLDNGKYTSNDVIVTWSEEGASATLNGVPYFSGDIISVSNLYSLVLSDNCGNAANIQFEINKDAPIYETNLLGEKANYSVYFSWSESGTTALLNEKEYPNKKWISGEGTYKFVITNKYGSVKTIEFSIKTKLDNITITPTGAETINLESGKKYKISSEFVINTNGTGILYVNEVEYTNHSLIESPGVYNVLFRDEYGNQLTYVIEITLSGNETTISTTTLVITVVSVLILCMIVVFIIINFKKQKNKTKLKIYKKK